MENKPIYDMLYMLTKQLSEIAKLLKEEKERATKEERDKASVMRFKKRHEEEVNASFEKMAREDLQKEKEEDAKLIARREKRKEGDKRLYAFGFRYVDNNRMTIDRFNEVMKGKSKNERSEAYLIFMERFGFEEEKDK